MGYGDGLYGSGLYNEGAATPPSASVVPTLTIEIGFAANPLDALSTVTWTDVTGYVRSWATGRGKNYQADRMETGTARIVLNNRDRRFDPKNAASPYYPNVKPLRRVRIRATLDGTSYTLFTGYIETWPQAWPEFGQADAAIQCVDAFSFFATLRLEHPYVLEVLKDSPKAYWRLNESSGASQASDRSGNGILATYVAPDLINFGQDDPITDEVDGAVRLQPPEDGPGYIDCGRDASISGTGAFSFEFWFRAAPGENGFGVIAWQSSGEVSYPYWAVVLQSDNTLFFRTADPTFILRTVTVNGDFADNAWRHMVCVRETSGTLRIYINGVLATSATQSGTTDLDGSFLSLGVAADGVFHGGLDEVAIYHSALSSTRIAAHYAARNAWLDQKIGTRMAAVLDMIGWPSADRDLDTGRSSLQSAGDLAGKACLTHLLDVADWDGGYVFVTQDGRVRFDDRHARLRGTALTSQATFAGTPTGSELGFIDVRPSYDPDEVYNRIEIQRENGALCVAEDATSITTYGRRVLSKSTKVNSDTEAMDRAHWEKIRRKDVLYRIDSITVEPGSDGPRWLQVLARELGDRITVKLRPTGGGAEIADDYHIDHIALTCPERGGMKQLTCTYLLAPAAREKFWALGVTGYSEIGQTTTVAH